LIFIYLILIGGILLLFIYITRLASKEIFSPSNKINREVGWAKDIAAPLYNKKRESKIKIPETRCFCNECNTIM